MTNTGMNAAPAAALDGERRSDFIALRLLELAIRAGWPPDDCIEFVREAYKLVTSSASAVGAQQTVALAKDIAVDRGQPGKSMPDSAPALHHPEWGPDPAARRKTLQVFADQDLTMKEVAEILGVSTSLVGSTAHRLKIRFHGPRGRGKKAKTTLQNGSLRLAPINGKAIPNLPGPADQGVKRRCPACNQVFQATKVNHILCEDCEPKQYAS